MWNLRPRAPALGLLHKHRTLRGMERLESRSLLNGHSLAPMNGPGDAGPPRQPDAFAMNHDFGPHGQSYGHSMPGDFGGMGSLAPAPGTDPFSGGYLPTETVVYIIIIPAPNNQTAVHDVISNFSTGNFLPPPGPQANPMIGVPPVTIAQPSSDVAHIAAPTTTEVASAASATAPTPHTAAATTSTQLVASTTHGSAAVGGASAAASDAVAESFLHVDQLLAAANRSTGSIANIQLAPSLAKNQHAAGKVQPEDRSEVDFARLIESKASLAEMPLNLQAVERALESVMTQIHAAGGKFNHWLEDHRLTFVAVAVTAATAGGATLFYLRRRTRQEIDNRDDETSSNWLFVRMQTTVGD